MEFSLRVSEDVVGGLRIGIHLQPIGATANSEFFVNGDAVVPVPAAAWLFSSALIGLAGIKRKKSLQEMNIKSPLEAV